LALKVVLFLLQTHTVLAQPTALLAQSGEFGLKLRIALAVLFQLSVFDYRLFLGLCKAVLSVL